MHAGHQQVRRGDLQGIAIEEHPRRIREAASQDGQFEQVPGIQLDHQMLRRRRGGLTQCRQHRDHAGLLGTADETIPIVAAQQAVQRRRLGQDHMAVQAGQHLRDQGRAAAGGMKNEGSWRQAGARGPPVQQRLEAALAPKRLVEGQAQGLVHVVAKEGPGQPLLAKPAPVHPPHALVLPGSDGQPADEIVRVHARH